MSEPPVEQATDDGYEIDYQLQVDLTALCQGPWRGVGDQHPFRGVRPEDNGGGHCCPLEDRAFLCVISPGHQHTAVVGEFARFFDGVTPKPRVSLQTHAFTNPGMAGDVPSTDLVSLTAIPNRDGFDLRPTVATACRKVTADTAGPCKAAGRYTWKDGVPVRAR